MENKKALIVVDMQEDYIGQNSRYHYYPNCLVDKVNKRIVSADKDGILVIYVKNKSKRNKEIYVSDFAKELVIVSNYWIEKDRASVFADDTLIELLKNKGITKIELIGIDGNCCVASSALEASKLGFLVVCPLEYIGIKDRSRFLRTKEKLLSCNVEVVE